MIIIEAESVSAAVENVLGGLLGDTFKHRLTARVPADSRIQAVVSNYLAECFLRQPPIIFAVEGKNIWPTEEWSNNVVCAVLRAKVEWTKFPLILLHDPSCEPVEIREAIRLAFTSGWDATIVSCELSVDITHDEDMFIHSPHPRLIRDLMKVLDKHELAQGRDE